MAGRKPQRKVEIEAIIIVNNGNFWKEGGSLRNTTNVDKS